MDTTKKHIQQIIKDYRFQMLGGIAIYSIICALLTLLAQSIGLWWLSLIPITMASYAYLQNMHNSVARINKGKSFTFKDLFALPTFDKKYIIVFVGYIIWAVFAFFVLRLLSAFPKLGLFLVLIMIVIFVASNAVSSTFIITADVNNLTKSYGDAIKSVITNYKIFGFTLIRSITAMIQGILITISVNVFAFGPQIQEALKAQEQGEALIKQIFANNISASIQTTGVQTILFYIMFLSAVIYTVHHTKSKRLKKR